MDVTRSQDIRIANENKQCYIPSVNEVGSETRMATIRDVAKLAGVSVASVSR